MAQIQKVLLVLIVNEFLNIARGQTLTAELLSVKLPKALLYTASVYDGEDSIYTIGGYDANEVSSKGILKLSLTDNSIRQIALLPSPINGGGAVIDDLYENIYYFGGYEANAGGKQEIYQFNLATQSVDAVGNLSSPSYFHAAIKHTSVFLIGGDPTLNYIQCWDIDQRTNCATKKMDKAFYKTSAILYGNEAFVFGNANQTDNEAEPAYKINLDTFETCFGDRILPDITDSTAAVVVGSKAYIIGGWRNQTDFPTNSILQVDVDSLGITALRVDNYIPNEQYFARASAVYVEKFNRIYVIGGYSVPYGYHDEIWAIDLSPIYVSSTTI